jgi:hypothetical protein
MSEAVYGPQEYTPSAQFTPVLTADVQPQQTGGGGVIMQLFGGIANIARAAASPKGQQAIGNVVQAVQTWQELDVRSKEASTAAKLANMAQAWLNPANYQTATPGIVSANSSAPATPGPADAPAAAGGSNLLLIGAVVVGAILLSRGR